MIVININGIIYLINKYLNDRLNKNKRFMYYLYLIYHSNINFENKF